MRREFWTVKSIHMLGNADSRVSEKMPRGFVELTPRYSFVLSGAYLLLIRRSGRNKKKKRSIPRDMKSPSPSEVLLFFERLIFVNQLQSMEESFVFVHYKM